MATIEHDYNPAMTLNPAASDRHWFWECCVYSWPEAIVRAITGRA